MYIAADNEPAAIRVESAITNACSLLMRSPSIGSKRSEITSLPVRFWVVTRYPNYVIVYRPDTDPLEIVTILHAKRNLNRLVADRAS